MIWLSVVLVLGQPITIHRNEIYYSNEECMTALVGLQRERTLERAACSELDKAMAFMMGLGVLVLCLVWGLSRLDKIVGAWRRSELVSHDVWRWVLIYSLFTLIEIFCHTVFRYTVFK